MAATMIAFLCGASQTRAADPDPRPLTVPCVSGSTLPANVYLPPQLLRHVDVMLLASQTFRAQCRRIAGVPRLRVLIRVEPKLAERPYRAMTTIERVVTGEVLARVLISERHNPIEWLAHEFEHVIEQLDGLRLAALEAANRGVWISVEQMYETARAIEAGRTVVAETQRARRATAPPDNFGRLSLSIRDKGRLMAVARPYLSADFPCVQRHGDEPVRRLPLCSRSMCRSSATFPTSCGAPTRLGPIGFSPSQCRSFWQSLQRGGDQ
jgi:hypothetical protein